MKNKFTYIALILLAFPFPMYASRYSSPGEAAFVGLLQGLFIMVIIWLISLFRKKKNDK